MPNMVSELRGRPPVGIGHDVSARHSAGVCWHSRRPFPRGSGESRWYRGCSFALEAICLKDERKDTPWYHLGSHTSSRKRPLRVPTHSCAVTCAHVVTYAYAVGHATPRPCSPDPSASLPTNRDSLCRICMGTLLFIVFAVCN